MEQPTVDGSRRKPRMNTVLEDALIVLDTMPEAYVRLDRELCFTFVNQAAQPFLSRPRSELLGRKLREAYPSTIGTALEECCRRAQVARAPVTLEQYFEVWQRMVCDHRHA